MDENEKYNASCGDIVFYGTLLGVAIILSSILPPLALIPVLLLIALLLGDKRSR